MSCPALWPMLTSSPPHPCHKPAEGRSEPQASRFDSSRQARWSRRPEQRQARPPGGWWEQSEDTLHFNRTEIRRRKESRAARRDVRLRRQGRACEIAPRRRRESPRAGRVGLRGKGKVCFFSQSLFSISSLSLVISISSRAAGGRREATRGSHSFAREVDSFRAGKIGARQRPFLDSRV